MTFHWRINEIKNDKDFTCTIKPRHTSTFAPLVKALRAYHRHIYPFLAEVAQQAGVDLEGQLFLEVLADGQVRRFSKDIDGAKMFADTFKQLTSRFLDFTDIKPVMRRQFHAHHIRGRSGDWLYKTLGVGTEGTAKFLANNRQTTERLYLNTRHIDSTPVLDEADARAMLLKTQRSKANIYTDEAGTVGSIYEQQIAYLTTQNELLQTKMDQISNLLEKFTHQSGTPAM
jgi:hypothetical protein